MPDYSLGRKGPGQLKAALEKHIFVVTIRESGRKHELPGLKVAGPTAAAHASVSILLIAVTGPENHLRSPCIWRV